MCVYIVKAIPNLEVLPECLLRSFAALCRGLDRTGKKELRQLPNDRLLIPSVGGELWRSVSKVRM